MAKPTVVANHFLGSSSSWDPLVSLNQSQTFGSSSMDSHNHEFGNSAYPLMMENQGMVSSSHLVHQYMSDSNFMVPSYASEGFSDMVGSFPQTASGDLANSGYRPNNGGQSQIDGSAPEEGGATGSAPNGSRIKRGLDHKTTFSASKVDCDY